MTRFRERSSVASGGSSEEEGEEHEQIRLVETPDPIICTKMNRFTNVDDPYLDKRPSNASYISSINPSPVASNGVNCGEKVNRIPEPTSSSAISSRDMYLNYVLSSSPSESHGRINSLWSGVAKKCKCTPVTWLISLFPILSWLPKYNWRNDLTFDLVAGTTICVMHIPQGMAYALLGNLQPVVGIYMAFFPVIVYTLMGTSRHVSMGTFAVICLMTGKVATERMAAYALADNNSTSPVPDFTYVPFTDQQRNDSDVPVPVSPYTAEQIATAISFMVGIWQILMGVFKLGSLSVLLSAELVSGFTTGAAVHVLTSQIKSLFGLSLPRRNGMFKIPLSYYDILKAIGTSNLTVVGYSMVTITCLVVYNEVIKPLIARKIPLPIPVELFTIIIGTLVSKYWITSAVYGVPIVDHIPTGLPMPSLPPLEILKDIAIDSLLIAIVAYTISISMSKIFATKHDYIVRPNQELLANGTSNFVGSFFSCAPIAASLSRSLIQEQVGGKTQLAGLFSCTLLVFVLLWIGPFFETLPQCVLSSMIVVALKGMFMQIYDLPKAWKESYLNASVWISAFLATVFLDIGYGLGIGLFLSILNLIWRSNRPYISVLGLYMGSSNVYVDSNYPMAKELSGIKIIKYTGSLNFATIEFFMKKVKTIVPPTGYPDPISRTASGVLGGIIVSTISREKINDNISIDDNLCEYQSRTHTQEPISWLVLDFSSLSSIDPAAVKSLQSLVKTYLKKDIQILFAGCPSPIIEIMSCCNLITNVGMHNFYSSVHEAVAYCNKDSSFNYCHRQDDNDNTSISDNKNVFDDDYAGNFNRTDSPDFRKISNA